MSAAAVAQRKAAGFQKGNRVAEKPPHGVMPAKSEELVQLLRSAGYTKVDGISTAGIKLVSRLAKANGLRDWMNTRTVADYDALIAVTREHLKAIAAAGS
jgi:hypothetical protein